MIYDRRLFRAKQGACSDCLKNRFPKQRVAVSVAYEFSKPLIHDGFRVRSFIVICFGKSDRERGFRPKEKNVWRVAVFRELVIQNDNVRRNPHQLAAGRHVAVVLADNAEKVPCDIVETAALQ